MNQIRTQFGDLLAVSLESDSLIEVGGNAGRVPALLWADLLANGVLRAEYSVVPDDEPIGAVNAVPWEERATYPDLGTAQAVADSYQGDWRVIARYLTEWVDAS